MKKVWEKLKIAIHYLKNNNKMFIVYICAIFLPLILADGFLFGILIQKEQNEQMYMAQNIADAVKFELSEIVDGALEKTSSVYLSREINECAPSTLYRCNVIFFVFLIVFQRERNGGRQCLGISLVIGNIDHSIKAQPTRLVLLRFIWLFVCNGHMIISVVNKFDIAEVAGR